MAVLKLIFSVPRMAEHLKVSHQRVLRLLAQGRLSGWKDPHTGRWQIPYPPVIQFGTRGPRLGLYRRIPPAAHIRSPERTKGNSSAPSPAEERK